jgi:putative membrane protein insertion efficiency factor
MSISARSSIVAGGKSNLELSSFMRPLSQICSYVVLLLIGAYRTIGTSHLGGQCRFEPSCSEYAMEAVSKHRPFFAIRLITLRILKCRPGGEFGFDPVPNEIQQARKKNSLSRM